VRKDGYLLVAVETTTADFHHERQPPGARARVVLELTWHAEREAEGREPTRVEHFQYVFSTDNGRVEGIIEDVDWQPLAKLVVRGQQGLRLEIRQPIALDGFTVVVHGFDYGLIDGDRVVFRNVELEVTAVDSGEQAVRGPAGMYRSIKVGDRITRDEIRLSTLGE
jgi:hypothetical protein